VDELSPVSGLASGGGVVPAASTATIKPRRSVAKNALALLLSQSFTWILATIVTAVQPRFIGPVGQGQLRLAYSLWTIIEMLAAFGTSTMLQVEVAKEPLTSLSLAHRVLKLRLICCAILVPFVAGFLWIANYDRTTLVVMFLLGVATLMSLATSTYRYAMYGLREMGKTGVIDVLSKLIVTVGVITILVLGGGVTALSVGGIFLAVFGLLMVHRSFTKSLPSGQVPSALVGRALISKSAPFLAADAALVVYLQVDTIVISLLVGPKEIGWYAAADTLFGSILFLPVILMTALFPAIAELHHRDPAEVDRLLVRTFRSLLIFAVPAGVGTIVIAHSFVQVLYGTEFSKSASVLQIYGIVTIFEFLTILLGRVALATERTRFWNILMLISIIASVPLDMVLVPWGNRHYQNGAVGGPLAYVVTELFMFIAGTAYLARGLRSRATFARVVKCLAAGGAMFAAGWPLRQHFFVVPGIVATVVYVVVLWALRTLTPDERVQLHRLAEPLTRRLPRAKKAAAAGTGTEP
jgi:O-antigen/teichoic acid export membrane protein